jgi:hypothetical protein
MGHLRLGHFRTMPRGLPERIVSEYEQRYPGVEIIASVEAPEQNVEQVCAGQLDVLFGLAPPEIAPELGCVGDRDRTHRGRHSEHTSVEPAPLPAYNTARLDDA